MNGHVNGTRPQLGPAVGVDDTRVRLFSQHLPTPVALEVATAVIQCPTRRVTHWLGWLPSGQPV